MPEASFEQLANLFRVLANPVRLELLRRLARGPLQWSVLVQELGCSRQAAARHIQLLKAAGLINAWDQPEYHVYRLEVGKLAMLETWLSRHRRRITPTSAKIAEDSGNLDPWESG